MRWTNLLGDLWVREFEVSAVDTLFVKEESGRTLYVGTLWLWSSMATVGLVPAHRESVTSFGGGMRRARGLQGHTKKLDRLLLRLAAHNRLHDQLDIPERCPGAILAGGCFGEWNADCLLP